MADVDTAYCYNAEPYLGKQGNQPETGLAQVVETLSRPLYNSHRNVTFDNFFTSVPLASSMLRNGLTTVGTLRANKPQIPVIMKKSIDREVHSSIFLSHDNLTLVFYAPPKREVLHSFL